MKTKNCKSCKKEFSKRKDYASTYWAKAKFCSKRCAYDARIGKVGYWSGKTRKYKNPAERAKKISQTMKGKRPIHLDYQKGEKHPNWRGGVSKLPGYRSLFDKAVKRNRKAAIGSHTYGEWQQLKEEYKFTCPSCKKIEPEIKLTEDHIVPLSKGGSNNIENIQPLCIKCNVKKFTKTIKYEYNK